MLISGRSCVAALAFALWMPGPRGVTAAPVPQVPPDFKYIDRDAVTVDGVPLELYRYRSHLSPIGSLQAWPQEQPAPPRLPVTAGGWHIMSRLHGALRETLQARPDGLGGSQLILSRIDLRASLAAPPELPFALPAGGAVQRAIRFDEDTVTAAQFIVAIPGRPAQAMALLCARLLAAGWRTAGGQACHATRTDAARWFMRGEETLGVDARRSGANTRAVIGHVGPRT